MRILSLILIAAAPACFAATPVVQGVTNAASFQPGTASAAWTAITGVNLSAGTRSWTGADFISGNLPTYLDDVSVTINGKSAYVYFISPGQINVLPPDDPATGTVAVQVTNSQGTSTAFMTNKTPVAPALFAYTQLNGVFAVIQTVLGYALVAPPNLLGPAANTYTASPGENLILYATGLGPTSPTQATGQLVQGATPTASPVTVTMGGQPAAVAFAGLIGAGLYQVNVTVPALRTGNAAIMLTVANQKSTQSVSVPVQAYISPSQPTLPQLSNCISGQVDSVTYAVARLGYGQADSVSIGGIVLCAACLVKPPIYGESAARMELALKRKQSIQACYDKNGVVYQVKLSHP